MELRDVLQRLERAIAYYWECPTSDQHEALVNLRAALAQDDDAELLRVALEVRALLAHYWSLPNTDQAEIIGELDAAATPERFSPVGA